MFIVALISTAVAIVILGTTSLEMGADGMSAAEVGEITYANAPGGEGSDGDGGACLIPVACLA